MGACVLCGKSAGLFYSLHKHCYRKFQSSTGPIVQLLTTQLETTPVVELVQQSQLIVQQLEFVEEAQQRALVRGLEAYAKQTFTRENYTVAQSKAWVKFLDQLDIDRTLFLDPNFIVEQRNLPAQVFLRNRELPDCNCNDMQFPFDLQTNESLWWRFSDVQLDQLQPKNQKQRWSIALQIVESVLPRKTKQSVEHKTLGAGTVWLTSQRLYFEKDQEIISIAYGEIYALTPEFDGVTLQSNESQARPQTFRCEDGKLLYQFLRYVKTA